MRVGFYQYKPVFGKVSKNLKKVVSVLSNIEADLIVLPELAFTGYYFRDRKEVLQHAEDPTKSSSIDSLIALCREKKFYLVSGFTEKRKDKCFNSSVLIGPEGLIHLYRKLHLFNTEKNCFDEGDTPLQVNTVMDCKIGMMICFDWVFAEVSRNLALQGADIICHPSNLVLSYCQQTMLTRSLENRVFSITANRTGLEKRPHGELKFTGKSQIVAPNGDLLYRAASQRENIYIMDIDPSNARDKSITAQNDVLEDRRPEYYSI
ncbi:MAG: acyltransferase [Gammaproteobacteria bacterium]|jgi:predicted amidohydrolase|nr:acyltransferase [Gammaproteobacteria bacterium]